MRQQSEPNCNSDILNVQQGKRNENVEKCRRKIRQREKSKTTDSFMADEKKMDKTIKYTKNGPW